MRRPPSYAETPELWYLTSTNHLALTFIIAKWKSFDHGDERRYVAPRKLRQSQSQIF